MSVEFSFSTNDKTVISVDKLHAYTSLKDLCKQMNWKSNIYVTTYSEFQFYTCNIYEKKRKIQILTLSEFLPLNINIYNTISKKILDSLNYNILNNSKKETESDTFYSASPMILKDELFTESWDNYS